MLHQSTLDFLTQLKENNNRDWFIANKKVYEQAKTDFVVFVEKLIAEMEKFDPSLIDLEAKKCLFRINRDVRFSKDKSPYKINFSAVMSAKGKNIQGSCYYLHLQPGASFVAGGYWMPEPEHLKAIRQEIDYRSADFKKIITDKEFVSVYGTLSEEEKLKNAPKEYTKDHPEIELLKLKSFTASSKLNDSLFFSTDPAIKLAQAFKVLQPFNQFLDQAIAEVHQ